LSREGTFSKEVVLPHEEKTEQNTINQQLACKKKETPPCFIKRGGGHTSQNSLRQKKTAHKEKIVDAQTIHPHRSVGEKTGSGGRELVPGDAGRAPKTLGLIKRGKRRRERKALTAQKEDGSGKLPEKKRVVEASWKERRWEEIGAGGKFFKKVEISRLLEKKEAKEEREKL